MSSSEKALYSLDLKGEGISVSKKIEEWKAKAILDIVLDPTPPPPVAKFTTAVSAGPATSPGAKSAARARMSLRELMDEANAKSNSEKIVVIGAYLEAYEGIQEFSREDAKNRFRSAGEPAPANMHRDIAAVVQNGWIAEESKKPGHFYVTQKGHNAIEQKFATRPGPKTGGRKSSALTS